MPNVVAVSLSDIKVAVGEGDVLVAYSLGSCVGVALWDPVTKFGGMAHVVLPSSNGYSVDVAVPGKYADTAVPCLVERLRAAGCQMPRFKVWIAGGAHVLKSIKWPTGEIGAANVKAVLEAIGRLGLPAPAMDVGEDYGRTMRLYVSLGKVTVASVGRAERDM
ncbi:MAG: chemotaxis protein CheD [Bacillota bacterium]